MRIALLSLVFVANAAFAQTPADSARADSAARELKAVTVTEARTPIVVGGASAVVVDPLMLRASPAPLLEHALRESPFVHVRQNSRGEMELSVRGSDSRQAAVLLDGVPISLGWDHRTDPSLIPIASAQSIVITRGLGTLLAGPNTLGGTIEVSHDNAFGGFGTGRLWGGAGVDENAAFVTAIGGGRTMQDAMSGTLSVRGGVAHRQRDGVSLPGDATDPTAVDGLRTNSDLTHTDGFAAARWNNSAGRSVGLIVSAFAAERGVPPEEHLTAPRYWRYPFQSRVLATLSASTGSFATPFGHGVLDLGGGFNSGRLKIQTYTNRTYATASGEERGDEKTWTGRALLTHSLGRRATFRSAFTVADVNYIESLPPVADADYRQRLWSAGGEVDIPVGVSTSLAGGVVYDKAITLESGGRLPAAEPFEGFGWRAGISRDVNAQLRLHASASQRARFPALRELYSGALERFRPNPELKPERLLGFEAGFTVDRSWGPIPDGSIQVTAFRHSLDDAIVRTTLTSPTRFLRVNRDRIQSTGAELLAGFVFGIDRERSVSLTGDALVQRIRIYNQTANDAERHAENNPGARGMLELGVPLPARLRAFANARYTGRQYCLNAETQNEMTLTAQTETDLAVERRFALAGRGALRGFRALLSLDNVSDAVVFDQCGLPQAGRTLRVMFTLQ